jgi:Flp pilus assembly protein TadG
MAAITPRLRRTLTNESGAELLELAIALPILMLIIGGVIDFGILFQRYEVVTNAAREGARVAVLPDFGVADVQARVTSYLAASGLDAAAPAPQVAYTTTEVTPGGPTISVAKVTVQYPHQFLLLTPLAGLLGKGAHGDLMLTAASTMRLEVAAAP